MGTEIERKFLVRDDSWQQAVTSFTDIRQAYLAKTGALSMRVRIRSDGSAALTIKSKAQTLSRSEFEYPVPVADAEALIVLAAVPIVEKRRHKVMFAGLLWEVDVFAGRHAGLVLAEVELPDASHDPALPPWVGEEVTGDARYYNETLARS